MPCTVLLFPLLVLCPRTFTNVVVRSGEDTRIGQMAHIAAPLNDRQNVAESEYVGWEIDPFDGVNDAPTLRLSYRRSQGRVEEP